MIVVLAHPAIPLTPDTLWSAWDWNSLILWGIEALIAVYGIGVYRLWQHSEIGHGVRLWQVATFVGAVTALIAALISPLDALSSVLFSAHMLQHMILILVAAPLLTVCGLPVALLWALPRRWSHAVGYWWGHTTVLRALWESATQPIATWIMFGLTLWLWHIPFLYEAALASNLLHGLEHISYLVTSGLFWWALLRPGYQQYGASVLAVFTTMLHSSVLGALLVFSSQPWYPAYSANVTLWGMTPLSDQQLAGLIMWLPMGLLYTIAAAVFFLMWLNALEQRMALTEVR